MNKKKLTKVLNWVNRQRKANGLDKITELIKGRPGNEYSCPIARSLRYEGNSTVRTWGKLTTLNGNRKNAQIIYHPKFIEQFVYDFDHGKIPELKESRTKNK